MDSQATPACVRAKYWKLTLTGMAPGGCGTYTAGTPGSAWRTRCSIWLAGQNLNRPGGLVTILGLAGFGADGEIHLGVRQIFIVIQRGGVNGRLEELEREGNHVAGHHGVEQQAQLFIQLGEAGAQVVVVVGGQIAGMKSCAC